MCKNEYENFILNYRVDSKNNTIIINYANGLEWIIPYNEKNENIVLDKMRKQVENSGEFYKKTKNKVKGLGKLLKVLIPTFVFTTLCLILGNIIGADFVIYAYVADGLLGIGTIVSSIKYLKTNYILNDLKINREFIEIEKELNNNIRKIEQNVLVNTSRKMQDIVKGTPEGTPVFNITSFNHVPYSDIQQVMDNIKRNEEFGFDYSDFTSVTKGKTRIRKR